MRLTERGKNLFAAMALFLFVLVVAGAVVGLLESTLPVVPGCEEDEYMTHDPYPEGPIVCRPYDSSQEAMELARVYELLGADPYATPIETAESFAVDCTVPTVRCYNGR